MYHINTDWTLKQLHRYKDLLAHFSKKNRELFFRPQKRSSLNITQDSLLNFSFSLKSSYFNQSLLETSAHPDLDDRLTHIRSLDLRYQKEYGLSGSWLLGPFLVWRDSPNGLTDQLYLSPLWKREVSLVKANRGTWQFHIREADSFQTNPSLQMILQKRLGLHMPDSFCGPKEEILNSVAHILSQKRALSVIFADQSIQHFGSETIGSYPHEFGVFLPKIFPKYQIIKDEDGQAVDRKPFSLEDLSLEEKFFYEHTTFEHFFLVDLFFVDHIAASKISILRDYEESLPMMVEHPVISGLLTSSDGQKNIKKIGDLDGYQEKENFFILPVDSSQDQAIKMAKQGPVLVIQGPPGTGKSQTIVNIIADHIASGKKVLFLAEKRAALDIVYQRMKNQNLDSRCVLIHSSDTDKGEFYRSFLQNVNIHEETKEQWLDTSSKLDELKKQMTRYYECLSSVFEKTQWSISDILTMYGSLSPSGSKDLALGELFSEKINKNNIDDLKYAFLSIENLLKNFDDPKNHPWFHKKRNQTMTLRKQYEWENVFSMLEKTVHRLCEIDEIFLTMEKSFFEEFCLHRKNLIDHSTEEYLWIVPEHFYEIDQKIRKKMDFSENKTLSFFKDDLDLDMLARLALYKRKHKIKNFFRFFDPQYWSMKSVFKKVITPEGGRFFSFDAVEHSMLDFSLDQKKNDQDILSFFSNFKLNMESSLKVFSHWKSLLFFMNFFKKKKFTIEYIKKEKDSFLEKIDHFLDASRVFFSIQEEKYAYIEHVNHQFDKPIFDQKDKYQDILDVLLRLKQTLPQADVFEQIKDMCQNICETFHIQPERWSFIFDQVMCLERDLPEKVTEQIITVWYDQILFQHAVIRRFDRSLFEGLIERFQNTEKKHQSIAKDMVHLSFKETQKEMDESVLTLIRRETLKQRNFLYPREILENGGIETMLNIKPCWMMSPLSVSQVLPLVQKIYDTIIIDEASQIPVEEILPSLLRGQSLVIVGDPKQMPPGNFFLSSQDEDDSLEEDEPLAESLLDLACRSYPAFLLTWHYRSRFDALIAFSNRAFYQGQLMIPPDAQVPQESALQWIPVEGGTFHHKIGNQTEAGVVISSLKNLSRTYPSSSIGVIAMGQSQKLALEQALQEALKQDAAFASWLIETDQTALSDGERGFFIKNLEHVQGDEREIILLSVGYGPGAKSNKLYLNFGPLTRAGGSRRLNVAITRAKQRLWVFCSFSPDQIPTSDEAFAKQPDLVCFGRYLAYVRAVSSHKSQEAKRILDSFGIGGKVSKRPASRFSLDVARRLKEKGYDVALEVGSFGFYVDIGIRHPSIPGAFILGIECDGAFFHSAPYARDRDRAREELLKAKGWKIARIWGPDWSRDWQKEMKRIIELI